ncbi:MAG: cyanase [Myxococcales bacterium]|nr:cyanase [Myxococcales bacterium]MDD9967210.1 cyanase [Myxococcales bacterium]
MTKAEMCEKVLAAKKSAGVTWQQLSEVTGMGAVYVASGCYGESSMPPEAAEKLGEVLSLSDDLVEELQTYPTKGWSMGAKVVPTDPLIYRFYEIMSVYGASMKDVIQEEFGDGIMSAIDFKLDVAREKDPKGDRVVVTMNGKFLPYKKW